MELVEQFVMPMVGFILIPIVIFIFEKVYEFVKCLTR